MTDPVCNIQGAALPLARQRDWQYARSLGLRPALGYFIAGEPLACYNGGGIYGPCPPAPPGWQPQEEGGACSGQ